MSDPTEIRRLEAEVQALEKGLAAARSAAERSTRTSLVFAGVVASMVLIFLLINYVRARAELTPEKFSRSLEQELREVGPQAVREFGILGQDLLPVYAAELRTQLEKAWPQISQGLQSEVVHLGDNLRTRIDEILASSEVKVIQHMREIVVQNYPELSDPAKQQELEQRLHAVCDQAIEKSRQDFEALFVQDVSRLQQEVLKFDVSDTHETTVDLQKKFLHIWLQLLDQEIAKI